MPPVYINHYTHKLFLLSSGHLRLNSWNIIITCYTYIKNNPNKPSVYTFGDFSRMS